MNMIQTLGVTMTSREIAELVGSRHDSVKRTIENLAGKRIIQLPPPVEVKNHLGQTVVEYVFSGDQGKRDSIIVVAQLCPEFTALLVDRWQELEGMQVQALPDFSNPSAAARAWADQFDLREEAVAALAAAAPKVEALRILSESEGTICITDAAKQLDMRPSGLFAWLRNNRWLYRRADDGPYVAYQPRIDAGYLCHKVDTIRREGKPDKLVESVRVTPKGLAKLAQAMSLGGDHG